MQLDRNEGFLALIDPIASSLLTLCFRSSLLTLCFRDRDTAGLPLFYSTFFAKEEGLANFYYTLFYSFFIMISSTMLLFSSFGGSDLWLEGFGGI